VKPSPEDVSAFIKDWLKAEIVETSKRYHELGKFLFSISSATVLFLSGSLKFSDVKYVDGYFLFSFSILFVSIFVSAIMLLPRNWKVGHETILEDELSKEVDRASYLVSIWFGLWILGSTVGLLAIFRNSASISS
jgi:hypothetical protein